MRPGVTYHPTLPLDGPGHVNNALINASKINVLTALIVTKM